MAAPSVALLGLVQTTADNANGFATGAADSDSETQGAGCVGTKVSNSLTAFVHTGTTRNFGAGGANEGDYVLVWMNCLTPTLDSKANGGLRVRCATSDWYVGGEDNRKPGWGAYLVDPTQAPSTGSVVTTTTDFGAVVKTVSNIMGNFNNGLCDQITIGKGLDVSDGDSGSPADFETIWSFDADTKANRYGFIRKDNGIYFLQGQFRFFTNSYVRLSSQVVVFEGNEFVADGSYLLTFDGDTNLGETGGNIFRCTDATTRAVITIGSNPFTDNGGLFERFFSLSLGAPGSSCTLNGTTVKNSGPVTQHDAVLNDVQIVDAETVGLIAGNYGNFNGLSITGSGTVGLDLTYTNDTQIALSNLVVTGSGTVDVRVDNDADVTLNMGANAGIGTAENIGAGNVTIVNAKTFEITGLVIGSRVSIVRASDLTILAETLSSGVSFQYGYEYAGDEPVFVRVISLGERPLEFDYTLGPDSTSIPIQQQLDRVYANP